MLRATIAGSKIQVTLTSRGRIYISYCKHQRFTSSSPFQLLCHVHQLQLNGHTLDQILQLFVGVVETRGIAFAKMRIADEAGVGGVCRGPHITQPKRDIPPLAL